MKPLRYILSIAAVAFAFMVWQFRHPRTASADGPFPPAHASIGGREEDGLPDKPASSGPIDRSSPAKDRLHAAGRRMALGRLGADQDKLREFLRQRGSDPQFLASAALWTRDAEVWTALKEKAASDPQCAAVLCLRSPTYQGNLEAALTLAKQDPENGFPYLAAAAASLRLKNTEAALDYLRRAAESTRMDLHAGRFLTAEDQLFKACGLDEIERGMLLTSDPWQNGITSLVTAFHELDWSQQSPEASLEIAGQLQIIIARLQTSLASSATIEARWNLIVVEWQTLLRQAGDTPAGEDLTMREKAKQLEIAQGGLDQRRSDVTRTLNESTCDIAIEYYRRALSSGELEASHWLLRE